jgi:hypothetical protein
MSVHMAACDQEFTFNIGEAAKDAPVSFPDRRLEAHRTLPIALLVGQSQTI